MTTLALTPGCPAGIGPEIFPKALKTAQLDESTNLIWCASAALFLKYAAIAGLLCQRDRRNVRFLSHGRQISMECMLSDEEDSSINVSAGLPDANALNAQRKFLDLAISLAKDKKVSAIVTGPVRKAALTKNKKPTGQTEYLHDSLSIDSNPPLMCFAGGPFLLGLATVHIPLKDVGSNLYPMNLKINFERLRGGASQYFGIGSAETKILCLGLNPHAGEGGLIGDEETSIISPLLASLNKGGFNIDGPVAADGFFGHLPFSKNEELPHAVLAMYHDQGLPAYKLLCNGHAVNTTLGLTVVRTSPGHGTADAIAGKNLADSTSLIKAIEIAQKMAILNQ